MCIRDSDLTICSRDSFFGEPELKFGAGIVTMLLPWVIGMKAAKKIIRIAKCCPEYYTEAEVTYARIIKKRIKHLEKDSK